MKPNRFPKSHPLRSLAAPALLLAASLPAWAQMVVATAPNQSVVVTAPRVDLRTVCPAVDHEMLTALSRVAMQLGRSALLDVHFSIDGRQIGDVAVTGGPPAYRRATRQAVHSLGCDSGSGGQQAVHLQVVFKDL